MSAPAAKKESRGHQYGPMDRSIFVKSTAPIFGVCIGWINKLIYQERKEILWQS